MTDVRVDELAKHVGETVTVRGWLYHRRSSGKLHFLEVRDGSGIVQCVVAKQNVTPDAFAQAFILRVDAHRLDFILAGAK